MPKETKQKHNSKTTRQVSVHHKNSSMTKRQSSSTDDPYSIAFQKQKYETEIKQIKGNLKNMLPDSLNMVQTLSDPNALEAVCALPRQHSGRFWSTLIDTVRLKIPIRIKDLSECKNTSKSKVRTYQYLVEGKFGTSATVWKSRDGSQLWVEFSVSKFLTGQNVAGICDMQMACRDGLQHLFTRMGLKLDEYQAERIQDLGFELVRVDIAVHCDCLIELRAHGLMVALRSHFAGSCKDMSTYNGFETLYDSQHSKYRTLCVYNKGRELQAKGRSIGHDVYSRDFLARRAKSLIRFELTFRKPALVNKKLTKPKDWTPEIIEQLLRDELKRVVPSLESVPYVGGMEKLSGITLVRFKLWLLGDATAFMQNEDTRRKQRKAVRDATGVDIFNPVSARLQREAIKNAAQILEHGLNFRSWEKKWSQLKRGNNSI